MILLWCRCCLFLVSAAVAVGVVAVVVVVAFAVAVAAGVTCFGGVHVVVVVVCVFDCLFSRLLFSGMGESGFG